MGEFLIGACAILGALISATAIIGVWTWSIARFRKSQRRLAEPIVRRWAESRDYQVVDLEHIFTWESPFYVSGGQVIYRMTVQDRDGRPRRGWICCGGLVLGLLSDHVEILWDDES
ncbi:MAG: hypothetical protein ABI353_08225 [Isosphaeraceae bacterium]